MEDILPIIIGLIWVGYKLYQKSNKQVAKQQNTPPKSIDSIFTTFEELLDPKKTVFDVPFVNKEYAVEGVNETFIVDRPEVKKPILEDVSEISHNMIEKKSVNLKNISEEPKNNFSDFDLKKAVLYHAILERPYK
jgi:hypothetical protein